MIRYVSGRLAQSILVMFLVAAVAFSLFGFVGDPIRQMITEDASQAEIERLRDVMGLNDPISIQFWRYISGAVQGDFGVSYFHKRPVGTLIAERMPATVELAGLSVLLSVLIGIPLGVYTGLNRFGRVARGLMAVSLIGISIPTFLIGIMLIYLFSVILGWLPSFGRGDTVSILGGMEHGLSDHLGPEIVDPAVHHPRAVPDNDGDAACPRRDAGRHAHRLYQVRPRPRPGQAGDQFPSCAEKHVDARGDGHRSTAWERDRLCHHHRKRLSVAGYGAVVPAGDPAGRYPGDVGLPHHDRLFLRHHQPDYRPCLLRD